MKRQPRGAGATTRMRTNWMGGVIRAPRTVSTSPHHNSKAKTVRGSLKNRNNRTKRHSKRVRK